MKRCTKDGQVYAISIFPYLYEALSLIFTALIVFHSTHPARIRISFPPLEICLSLSLSLSLSQNSSPTPFPQQPKTKSISHPPSGTSQKTPLHTLDPHIRNPIRQSHTHIGPTQARNRVFGDASERRKEDGGSKDGVIV